MQRREIAELYSLKKPEKENNNSNGWYCFGVWLKYKSVFNLRTEVVVKATVRWHFKRCGPFLKLQDLRRDMNLADGMNTSYSGSK